MICPQCKKQIPDDANDCGYCGAQINHQDQVVTEISYRRYQRWFFYALIVLIILGMVGVIVRVSNANSENLAKLATAEERFQETEQALEQTEEELSAREQELQQTEQELTQAEQELDKKTKELQEELTAKAEIREEFEDCQLNLNQADSHLYSLIINLGKGVSNEQLRRIPLADANLEGEDTSGNGLSDIVEIALGTDPEKADTNGNGYDDKTEILSGYDPLNPGQKIDYDWDFVNANKGRILLQVESHNEAWYLADDGKKYFMGRPAEAFEILKSVEYWEQEKQEAEEDEEVEDN